MNHKIFVLLALFVFSSTANLQASETVHFFDDFKRPPGHDNTMLGNGWTESDFDPLNIVLDNEAALLTAPSNATSRIIHDFEQTNKNKSKLRASATVTLEPQPGFNNKGSVSIFIEENDLGIPGATSGSINLTVRTNGSLELMFVDFFELASAAAPMAIPGFVGQAHHIEIQATLANLYEGRVWPVGSPRPAQAQISLKPTQTIDGIRVGIFFDNQDATAPSVLHARIDDFEVKTYNTVPTIEVISTQSSTQVCLEDLDGVSLDEETFNDLDLANFLVFYNGIAVNLPLLINLNIVTAIQVSPTKLIFATNLQNLTGPNNVIVASIADKCGAIAAVDNQ